MSPSRARRVALACCLALGCSLFLVAGAGIVGGSPDVPDVTDRLSDSSSTTANQPQPVEGIALPERLEPATVAAEGSAEIRADAAAAVHRDGAELGTAFDRHLVREQLERASTEASESGVVEETLADSNRTISELRDRERSVLESYQDGDVTAIELATTLAMIDQQSQRELRHLEALEEAASERDITAYEDETVALRAQALHRQGSVRAQVGSMIAADEPSRDVFLASGGEGVVLATIDGTDYYREANVGESQVATNVPGIEPEEAWDLRGELYPTFDDEYRFTSMPPLAIQQLYRIEGDYEYGELVTYVDAHSEEVAREDQHLRLTQDLPTADPIVVTEENATMALNRTYASGPASVRLYEDEEPVAGATVTIDGDEVAETDSEGTAWVVLPYDDPEIGVTHGATALNATVEWDGTGG